MTQFSRSQTADQGTALPGGRGGPLPHDQKGEDMKRKHWTLIVPGAVLLCAIAGIRRSNCGTRFKPHSTPIRKSGRRLHNKLATKEERKQAEGPVVSAHFGRRLGGRARTAQPDPPRPRHRRRDAVAGRRLRHRRPAAVEHRRPRRRDQAPGVAHRRRRGPRRGALRIRRAQRQPRLHRLSAAAAAGGDRAGQCDLPRAAGRRPSRRRRPRARSASPTSSRPKSGCNRPAPA